MAEDIIKLHSRAGSPTIFLSLSADTQFQREYLFTGEGQNILWWEKCVIFD